MNDLTVCDTDCPALSKFSEHFAQYMQNDDPSVVYANLSDDVITEEIKHDAIKTKGYFIYSKQLFCNVVANANHNDRLNTDLREIFDNIENSASGFDSEQDIKGLFADFDTTSNRLGISVTKLPLAYTNKIEI